MIIREKIEKFEHLTLIKKHLSVSIALEGR